MGRRRRNSVVPFVVLGAAVSIGVVALTASRFGWRRTKAEPPRAIETPPAPEPDVKEPRFKPAPPRPADAPRWDSLPAEYAKSDRASPQERRAISYIRRTQSHGVASPHAQNQARANPKALGALIELEQQEQMKDAVATDGPPPPDQEGARVSDRFMRSRVPMLPTVLFADASEDYRSMAKDALLEGRNATDMRSVGDGGELLKYLRDAPDPAGRVKPFPSLIVLDAALPGDPPGLEAVKALKQDPATRRIPVVALGATDDEATIAAAYEAGVNTYIVKPVTFLALVRLMKVFTAYWLETAELPPGA